MCSGRVLVFGRVGGYVLQVCVVSAEIRDLEGW